MSGQARPWWASDGPVDGGIARDEDPVERVRAARRGESPTADADATADATAPWLDALAETMTRLADAADEPEDDGDPTPRTTQEQRGAQPHLPDICGVCPICVGMRTLAETRPELVGHLAEAARHVALAARSLRDRPEEATGGGRRGDARRGDPLEHIDLE